MKKFMKEEQNEEQYEKYYKEQNKEQLNPELFSSYNSLYYQNQFQQSFTKNFLIFYYPKNKQKLQQLFKEISNSQSVAICHTPQEIQGYFQYNLKIYILSDIESTQIIQPKLSSWHSVERVVMYNQNTYRVSPKKIIDINHTQNKYYPLTKNPKIKQCVSIQEMFDLLKKKIQPKCIYSGILFHSIEQNFKAVQHIYKLYGSFTLINASLKQRQMFWTKFINYSTKYIKKKYFEDQELIQEQKNLKQYKQLQTYKIDFSKISIKQEQTIYNIIKFYQKQNFYYKIINNSLIKDLNIQQLQACFWPIYELQTSISYFYKIDTQQNLEQDSNDAIAIRYLPSKIQKNQKKVCRACFLQKQEFQVCKNQKGGLIQLKGFISTSTDLQTVSNFLLKRKSQSSENACLIFITIPKTKIQQKYFKYDKGYADFKRRHGAQLIKEDQVLFNPMNYFKVLNAKLEKVYKINEIEFKQIMIVELQYGGFIEQLIQAGKYSRIEVIEFSKLNNQNSIKFKSAANIYNTQNQTKKIISVADSLLFFGKYRQSLQFIEKFQNQKQDYLIKISKVYQSQGNLKEAVKYNEKYIQSVNNPKSQIRDEKINQLKLKIENLKCEQKKKQGKILSENSQKQNLKKSLNQKMPKSIEPAIALCHLHQYTIVDQTIQKSNAFIQQSYAKAFQYVNSIKKTQNKIKFQKLKKYFCCCLSNKRPNPKKQTDYQEQLEEQKKSQIDRTLDYLNTFNDSIQAIKNVGFDYFKAKKISQKVNKKLIAIIQPLCTVSQKRSLNMIKAKQMEFIQEYSQKQALRKQIEKYEIQYKENKNQNKQSQCLQILIKDDLQMISQIQFTTKPSKLQYNYMMDSHQQIIYDAINKIERFTQLNKSNENKVQQARSFSLDLLRLTSYSSQKFVNKINSKEKNKKSLSITFDDIYKSLENDSKLQTKTIARFFLFKTELYIEKGDSIKAKEAFEQSEKIYKKLKPSQAAHFGDELFMVPILTSRIHLLNYTNITNSFQALNTGKKLMQQKKISLDTHAYAFIERQIAIIHFRKDFNQCKKSFELAIRIFQTCNSNNVNLAVCRLDYALYLLMNKNKEEQNYQKIIKLILKAGQYFYRYSQQSNQPHLWNFYYLILWLKNNYKYEEFLRGAFKKFQSNPQSERYLTDSPQKRAISKVIQIIKPKNKMKYLKEVITITDSYLVPNSICLKSLKMYGCKKILQAYLSSNQNSFQNQIKQALCFYYQCQQQIKQKNQRKKGLIYVEHLVKTCQKFTKKLNKKLKNQDLLKIKVNKIYKKGLICCQNCNNGLEFNHKIFPSFQSSYQIKNNEVKVKKDINNHFVLGTFKNQKNIQVPYSLISSNSQIYKNYCIIYFHDNKEDIGTSSSFLKKLSNTIPIQMYSMEYPNHGTYRFKQNKHISDQIKSDSQFFFNHIQQKKLYRKQNIYVFGRSIGSGPACHLASKGLIQNLILLSPFPKCSQFFCEQYLDYDVKKVKEHFDNVQALKSFKGNLLIIHGMQDSYVPIQYGQRLRFQYENSHKKRCDFVKQKGMRHSYFDIEQNVGEPIKNFIK